MTAAKGGAGGAMVIQGDALHLPPGRRVSGPCGDLAPETYFALRDYGTASPHEVGSEPTPAAWLHALWAATAEMKRVLKPTGSIFVNLGDKYDWHLVQHLHKDEEDRA